MNYSVHITFIQTLDLFATLEGPGWILQCNGSSGRFFGRTATPSQTS